MGVFQPEFEPSGNNGLLTERAVLVGTMLSFMAYGYTVLTAILCLRELRKRPALTARWVFIVYVSLLFLVISTYMGLNTTNKVRAFTKHRTYPGGPEAWIRSRAYGVRCIAGNICICCSIWLSDGFLLSRALVLYTTRQWLLIPALLLYMGSLVTGSLYISEHIHSTTTTSHATPFAVPSLICASLCNLAIVSNIALRLLWYRQLVRQLVGRDQREHHELYDSVLTILIESAVLYAAASIVYIVSYALNSAVASLVVATLVNVRGIASFLIIHRLVKRLSINDTSCLDTGNGVMMTQCLSTSGCTTQTRSVQTTDW